MRLNYKRAPIVFVLIAVLTLFLVFLNLSFLKNLIQDSVNTYGLLAILIFSFLADFIEQPIGPEVPSGFAVALGLNFWLVFLFSVVGSYAGSFGSYFIGKKFLSYKKILDNSEGKNKKYIKKFEHHWKIGLFIAAISPIPYVTFCWLAGAIHMRIKDFIIFGLIPRAIRIAFVMGIVGIIF